jgi:hypothetical protein
MHIDGRDCANPAPLARWKADNSRDKVPYASLLFSASGMQGKAYSKELSQLIAGL